MDLISKNVTNHRVQMKHDAINLSRWRNETAEQGELNSKNMRGW